MSIKSWQEEFFPEITSDVLSSELSAAKHSLRAWIGRLPENLKRHSVDVREDRKMVDEHETFGPSTKNCALCHLTFDEQHLIDCSLCPLFRFKLKCCPNPNSSYQKYLETGNPVSMIKVIKKVVEILEKAENEVQ